MFRDDFVWGAASASFQIEGAWKEDGKGESIWDRFNHTPGRILNGETADVACDFYHRFREDISIMARMGIKAYRFSLSWPRILPEGTGRINEAGIAFYNEVINELLKNGIEPYVTLYHWDFPQVLQDRGGWLNEESISWFAEYAAVVARVFSDRVKYFITMNEPQCFIGNSFVRTNHAPGIQLPVKDQFQMTHNVLRAHGAAVIALRKNAVRSISVGYAPTCGMVYPKTETAENIEACRKYLFACPDLTGNWAWNVAWFSDPVFLGKYPEEGREKYAQYLPNITQEDLDLISQPLDFMGENIYNGVMVEADAKGNPVVVERYTGFPSTGIGWPITPECFRWGLGLLYERYQLPIYVTENGISCKDVIAADGRVHDPDRIDFLNRYLLSMKEATDHGVDIRGYFHWSLTDNFEWQLGYRERFGLVYVDYRDLRRIRKDSSYWYEQVIRTNGESLAPVRELRLTQDKDYDGALMEVCSPVQLSIKETTRVEVLSGYGEINALSVTPGQCICIPANFGDLTMDGKMTVRVEGKK